MVFKDAYKSGSLITICGYVIGLSGEESDWIPKDVKQFVVDNPEFTLVNLQFNENKTRLFCMNLEKGRYIVVNPYKLDVSSIITDIMIKNTGQNNTYDKDSKYIILHPYFKDVDFYNTFTVCSMDENGLKSKPMVDYCYLSKPLYCEVNPITAKNELNNIKVKDDITKDGSAILVDMLYKVMEGRLFGEPTYKYMELKDNVLDIASYCTKYLRSNVPTRYLSDSEILRATANMKEDYIFYRNSEIKDFVYHSGNTKILQYIENFSCSNMKKLKEGWYGTNELEFGRGLYSFIGLPYLPYYGYMYPTTNYLNSLIKLCLSCLVVPYRTVEHDSVWYITEERDGSMFACVCYLPDADIFIRFTDSASYHANKFLGLSDDFVKKSQGIYKEIVVLTDNYDNSKFYDKGAFTLEAFLYYVSLFQREWNSYVE